MGLDGSTLKRLEAASSGFVTKNHRSYLAEAASCFADTNDPIAAIKLLHAMWGTYATRPEQHVALNDVGRWLEERLHREPHISVAVLALELGWLRRFAQIAEDAHRRDGRQERHARGEPRLSIAFGHRIHSIMARRAEQPTGRHGQQGGAKPSPKAVPPPPKELPAVFQAEFVNFSDAREARKTARKRQQAGKQAKDRLLGIRPTAPELAPLAAGLVCSLLETAGFDAPFEAAERANGAERTFYVTAIEERDGKRLVRALALTAPQR